MSWAEEAVLEDVVKQRSAVVLSSGGVKKTAKTICVDSEDNLVKERYSIDSFPYISDLTLKKLENWYMPFTFVYGSSIVYKDELHLFGGYGSTLNKHYKYNKNTKTWTTLRDTPLHIAGAKHAVIYEDNIHILMGSNASTYNDHYKYNDTNDTWTAMPGIPSTFKTYGSQGVAASHKGKIYITSDQTYNPSETMKWYSNAIGSAQDQNLSYAWNGTEWEIFPQSTFSTPQSVIFEYNDTMYCISCRDTTAYTTYISKWNDITDKGWITLTNYKNLPQLSTSNFVWGGRGFVLGYCGYIIIYSDPYILLYDIDNNIFYESTFYMCETYWAMASIVYDNRLYFIGNAYTEPNADYGTDYSSFYSATIDDLFYNWDLQKGNSYPIYDTPMISGTCTGGYYIDDDNNIIILNGRDNYDTYKLDVSNKRWVRESVHMGAYVDNYNRLSQLNTNSIFTIYNNELYMFTYMFNNNNASSTQQYIHNLYKYDIENNLWIYISSLGHNIAISGSNGDMYTFDGKIRIACTTANAWYVNGTSFSSDTACPVSAYSGSVIVNEDGRAYMYGSSDIYVRNPGSNSWVRVANNLPSWNAAGAARFIRNNILYVLGKTHQYSLNKYFKVDIDRNTVYNFSEPTPMPRMSTNYYQASQAIYDKNIDKAYIITFNNSTGQERLTYMYDPENNEWYYYYYDKGTMVIFNNIIYILRGHTIYSFDGTKFVISGVLPYSFTKSKSIVYNNKIHIIGDGKHYSWDGNDWEEHEFILNDMDMYPSLAICNDSLYMLYDNKLYNWNNTEWTYNSSVPTERFNCELLACRGYLYATKDNFIYKYIDNKWVQINKFIIYRSYDNGTRSAENNYMPIKYFVYRDNIHIIFYNHYIASNGGYKAHYIMIEDGVYVPINNSTDNTGFPMNGFYNLFAIDNENIYYCNIYSDDCYRQRLYKLSPSKYNGVSMDSENSTTVIVSE